MYRNHTVGVIVPAYNEAAFVGDVVRDLPAFVDAIILVDDASTDNTWREMGAVMDELSDDGSATGCVDVQVGESSLAERLAAVEKRGAITRVRHGENRGAGGAVKTGYLLALKSDIDVVATIDGDGQMDSSHLSTIIDPVVTGIAGYAKGNRFASRAVFREMPPFRLFGNLLLTGLTRLSSGYWRLSDPQNGYTAISQSALRAADVETLWEYYGYMNQLLARLNTARVQIADVPMPTTYGDEQSGIAYREYIPRVSLLLLVSFLSRLWAEYAGTTARPVALGYMFGTLIGGTKLLQSAARAVLGDRDASLRDAVVGLSLGIATVIAAPIVDATLRPHPTGEDEDNETERRSTESKERA